jgi:hypothetical protein
MQSPRKIALVCTLVIGGGSPALLAAPQAPGGKPAATIRRVAVLGGGSVEVEIVASEPVIGQGQVVTNPDRLVIDFPNAVPGADLHNFTVNRGAVKDIRVGLLTAHPPVTRVVLDLKTPQPYQLFPSGKTLIVKLNSGRNQTASPGLSAIAPSTPASPLQAVTLRPRLEVHFQNGKLSIWADKATLAEVLTAVQRQTGADIPIPAGADQEPVAANFGPAPARDVLASLLNGSRFNFIMVGSARNPAQLRSVLLTPRGNAIPQPVSYSPPPPVAQMVPEPAPTQAPEQPEILPDQREPGDAPEPQR